MADRILITGATGTTGSALTRHLNTAEADFVRATRKPDGPHDRQFDWRDGQSYDLALDGVSKIYLVAPTDTSEPLAVMLPFLEQAIEGGVEKFVLLSASSLPRGGPMTGAVHEWLAEQDVNWSVLRPTWFMQNFVTQHLSSIHEDNAIYSATGQGRVPFIDASDIAAVAARVLLDSSLVQNADIVLTGPQSLTYADVAAVLSKISGRTIRHINLTPEQLAARHRANGLPDDYATTLALMDAAIAEGSEDRVSAGVADITGRAPNDLEAVLSTYRVNLMLAA
ncbi:NmrA family NAD(P)-binding protein [Devosia sp. BK]|uniref:NmrA family NAD(P)-binding protein n=1 Tax=Devosia sp. BK TaxID=2871706 RepID=UPI00293B58BF|nr:NmrA family NAD(P)-binding protein [Devosia sp. BK]MDV3249844.1 NmrA family NAD(P)-binding protein [Devosia sp. BK]